MGGVVLRAAAAEAPAAKQGLPVAAADAVATLKAACVTRLPGAEVCSAILALEKAKIEPDKFLDFIGGENRPGGKTWKLVFTASSQQVKEASKGGRGGGLYFPLTACQRWDASSGEIENGVYVGQIAALAFRGPFSFSGRKLAFTFDTLRLRLGPKWFSFKLKAGQFGAKEEGSREGSGPFFLFAYADEDLIVARGKQGGFGVWAKAPEDFLVRAGIVL